jgi:hypothetical protein
MPSKDTSTGATRDGEGDTTTGPQQEAWAKRAGGADGSSSSDEDDEALLAGPGPRVRLVVLACFDSVDSIIEREALVWLHANCPDIRIVFNLSRKPAAGAGALSGSEHEVDGGPVLTSGRLDAEKLVDILPRNDLLTVTCCGAPSFVEDVRDIYLRLGLPRPLFTVVA